MVCQVGGVKGGGERVANPFLEVFGDGVPELYHVVVLDGLWILGLLIYSLGN